MSEVGGVGVRRHFSSDEEEALRRDESTNSIVQRDGKTNVNIHGLERTLKETKEHQQSVLDNKVGGLDLLASAFEGAELLGAFEGVTKGAALIEFAGVAAPVVELGLGVYNLLEAHVKGDEQGRAIAKDDAHVALIAALDLPPTYQAARLDGAFKHVQKDTRSPSTTMTLAIKNDPKGLAVLQLHADRGMNAARDLSRSGLRPEAFLKSNPKVAENYSKDAAFREGFDAYLHAKATLPRDQVKALDQKLDERDGWYAQSHVSFRV